MANDRREFLKVLGGLTAVVAGGAGCDAASAATGAPLVAASSGTVTAQQTTATSDHFLLELEGTPVGYIDSVSGGGVVGRVVTERGPARKKHLAGLRYEDITFSCGADVGAPLDGWIQDALAGPATRSGAIVLLDFQFAARERLEFTNAVIRTFTLPACDGASKDAGQMTLVIAPETTRWVKGDGSKPDLRDQRNLQWKVSSYSVQIDGLEQALNRVVRVAALTFQAPAEGRERDEHDEDEHEHRRPVGGLEVPDLVITVTQADADPVLAWEQDFLIGGNDGDDKERSGTLTYLDPTLSKPIVRVGFKHLGLFRMEASPRDASTDAVATMVFSMYCEAVDLTLPT